MPWLGRRVAWGLERAGARALALRIDRLTSVDDVVTITVPSRPGSSLHPQFRMYALDGRDQVVRAIRDGGWHAFEPPLPAVVSALVRRWPHTMLDVGANTGFYSLVAVTSHPEVRAFAYEPVPEIVVRLRANLAANSDDGRVRVREAAVSDRTAPVPLHFPPAQPDGTIETSASVESDFKEALAQVVTVDGITLDDAWTAEGRPQVGLVKIDVEGAEHRVLAGAGDLTEACRPVLTVEILPLTAHLDGIEAFRQRHRYVDVTLGAGELGVNRSSISPDALAPNHLLVPEERVDEVVETLRSLPDLSVSGRARRYAVGVAAARTRKQ